LVDISSRASRPMKSWSNFVNDQYPRSWGVR
jgi:hypothetical protein